MPEVLFAPGQEAVKNHAQKVLMDITRATDMTEAEEKFIGVAPWLVAGPCSTCGNPVTVAVYGLKSELKRCNVKLDCGWLAGGLKECNK